MTSELAHHPVFFCDIETTGLDLEAHSPWEVAVILPNGEGHRWFLGVNASPEYADPVALEIGGYHDRHPDGARYPYRPDRDYPHRIAPSLAGLGPFVDYGLVPRSTFAFQFTQLVRNARLATDQPLHMAGAVPSFDAYRIARVLKAYGIRDVPWHYHTVDVEALVAGLVGYSPPWNSDDLSKQVGVTPDLYERHTAYGDCLWARAIYKAVLGIPVR